LRLSLRPSFEPLVDLTEPFSGKLLKKMERLSHDDLQPVIRIVESFATFAFFGLALYMNRSVGYPNFKRGALPLPLVSSLPKELLDEMPQSLINLQSARLFGEAMRREARAAIQRIETAIEEHAGH
jgi:hypothetical protein